MRMTLPRYIAVILTVSGFIDGMRNDSDAMPSLILAALMLILHEVREIRCKMRRGAHD